MATNLHRRTLGRLSGTAAILLALAPAAGAQELPDLTIEQLMGLRVERVFGASERLQPVTEAPASVTIVTADEIRRHGYRTLAEILQGARGFYVSDDRNYSYVGVRGFGLPGDYNSRILLLINGHKVNDNIYDQAYVGAELGLDVSAFARVEIIRGPASSLYGTSAFFAVVNIITHTGASLAGGAIEAETGGLGTRAVRGAYGRQFTSGVDIAVTGALARSHGVERLYFPAFDDPETNHGIAADLDGERLESFYVRIGLRRVALTAAHGYRHKDVPTASYSTLFNWRNPHEETRDARTMLSLRHDGAIGRSRLVGEIAYDRLRYSGVYPYEGAAADAPASVLDDHALGARWSGTVRFTHPLPGQQTLTAGAEFLASVTQRQWYTYRDGAYDAATVDTPSEQGAVYLQDEVRVSPWLLVSGGIRHDVYERFSRTTPRGAVIVIPTSNQSIKYLYGRAFRAPNAYELYYYADVSDALRPETIDTHEMIWEQYVGEWLRTSVSAYRYAATGLISLQADEDGEFSFVNIGTARARGIEVEAELRTRGGVQVLGSGVLQRARDSERVALPNSPGRTGSLRISAPVFGKASAAFAVWGLSTRRTVAGTTLASARVAQATLTAPITPSLELVASVRNLFDTRYAHPASEEHAFDAIEQNGRTARLGLRWSFGSRTRSTR